MKATAARTIASGAMAALAFGVGCASKPHENVSVDLDRASVTPEDLGTTFEQLSTSGSRHLDSSPSKGRFPAGIAVAKVVSKAVERDGRRNVRIVETPLDQAVYWNGLFDSLPTVREVATLHGLGLDPRGTTWGDILKESIRIDCHLCLIYGRLERDHDDADLIGVLWDAQQTKALAAFRAPLVMDEDRLEEKGEEDYPEGVLSPAEYDAEADLRELVRSAVWDLSRRDEPAATTQPSPWQSDESLAPRNERFIIELEPKLHRGRR